MKHPHFLPLAAFILLSLSQALAANEPTKVANQGLSKVWISSATAGIYAADLDTQTGVVNNLRTVQQGISVSYIAKHPRLDVLYAVIGDWPHCRLASYAIEPNGDLVQQSELQQRPFGGAHINVSPDGNYLAVAYYSAGITGVYSLGSKGGIEAIFDEAKHTGSSVNKERQTSAHPHWAGFSDDSRLVYVPDLGTDHIWVHEVDKKNAKLRLVQKAEAPAGAGPRHMAFHPALDYAYVSDELSSSVSRYAHDTESGKLSYLDSQISAKEASDEFWHNVSDIRVHPSGQFLYLVNRGFDQVSVFGINPTNGKLTPIEREPIRGSISRNIGFDASGRWALVAGRASNTLTVFDVDLTTGELRFTNQVLAVPTPKSIVINN